MGLAWSTASPDRAAVRRRIWSRVRSTGCTSSFPKGLAVPSARQHAAASAGTPRAPAPASPGTARCGCEWSWIRRWRIPAAASRLRSSTSAAFWFPAASTVRWLPAGRLWRACVWPRCSWTARAARGDRRSNERRKSCGRRSERGGPGRRLVLERFPRNDATWPQPSTWSRSSRSVRSASQSTPPSLAPATATATGSRSASARLGRSRLRRARPRWL